MSKRSDDFSKNCLAMMIAPWSKEMPEHEVTSGANAMIGLTLENKINLDGCIRNISNQSNFLITGNETDSYKTRVCLAVAKQIGGINLLEIPVDSKFLCRGPDEDYASELFGQIDEVGVDDKRLLVVFNGFSDLFESVVTNDDFTIRDKEKRLGDLSRGLAQGFSDYKYYKPNIGICVPIDDMIAAPSAFYEYDVFDDAVVEINVPDEAQRYDIVISKLANVVVNSMYHSNVIIDLLDEEPSDESSQDDEEEIPIGGYIEAIIDEFEDCETEEIEEVLDTVVGKLTIMVEDGRIAKINQEQIFNEVIRQLQL